MRKEEVLALLRSRWPELRALGVTELYLFGSLARDEAAPGSDVDLLVVFATPPGFEGYWRVKEFLESLLGRPVDLVMKGALKPWAVSEVLGEAVRVA
ncbi:nucleotidyltransferase [Thermus parvatiensis]|uniref:Nucleotidyltransferase n=1 Tax=Thermus parvatiensis TaxID=456163 RepID=H7GEJ7_9DEIN|nr:nucleotidyltransferase family protein [Thermus parvatiensis]AMA75490.1 nucleotidyltransferase [Thermus parvatiensis]EIA39594.1 hypothetical protein RLTM_02556 [Thermus parvatiensis]